MVTKTETVEVPVEVVKPVPTQLTDPLPYPDALGEQFTVGDLIDQLLEMYRLLDQANADRDSVRRLTTPE